jgi:hypothetical protein
VSDKDGNNVITKGVKIDTISTIELDASSLQAGVYRFEIMTEGKPTA